MAYATIQQLLARLGHDDAVDPALTSRMTDAITAATTAIDNDTGRSFTQSENPVAKVFGSTDPCELRIPDLVSATSIMVDDTDDGTFETTLVAADYELDTVTDQDGWPFEIVRLLNRTWPSGGNRRRRIQITGTWGWAEVPAPINQACTLLAGRLGSRSSSAVFGVQSFGDLGAASIRNNDPDYMNLIRRYKRPMVA